jgi:Fe-S cluster assembly scaffold IscU
MVLEEFKLLFKKYLYILINMLRNFIRKPFSSLYLNTKRFYGEKVIQHFNQPKNVGSLDKNDPNVGTGLVGAPACGDVLKLQIKVDENNKIVDAKFKTFGCASAISSSSYSSEIIINKTLEEASKITNQQIANELNLPPVKIHCSMLAEDAIKAAVEDVKKKKCNDKPKCNH